MGWTAPYTATSNDKFDASEFNATCRDDFLETETAKAVIDDDALWYPVTAGANSIVARRINSMSVRGAGQETTTSTSYVHGSSMFDADFNSGTYGPTVTCETGTTAVVFMSCELGNSTDNTYAACTFEVKTSGGSTTIAADDDNAIEADGLGSGTQNTCRKAVYKRVTGLTAGTNVFTMKYRQSGGTGIFERRHLIVMPF